MADWDWVKTALQAIVPLVTGTAGLFLGTWQAGKKSGKQEAEIEAKIKADIKAEFDKQLEGMRNEMRTAVAEASDNRDLFTQQFQDTFAALRQQINNVELAVERRFLPQPSFDKFLDEYRDDRRRTDDKLDKLLGLNGARGSK